MSTYTAGTTRVRREYDESNFLHFQRQATHFKDKLRVRYSRRKVAFLTKTPSIACPLFNNKYNARRWLSIPPVTRELSYVFNCQATHCKDKHRVRYSRSVDKHTWWRVLLSLWTAMLGNVQYHPQRRQRIVCGFKKVSRQRGPWLIWKRIQYMS